MKKIVAIVLIGVLVISCTQEEDSRKYVNTIIESNGILIKGKMSSDSLFDGRVDYFIRDTLVAFRTFQNGAANGKSVSYYPNGVIKQLSNELNGKVDGVSLLFNQEGNILRSQFYFQGRLMGPQVVYDSNGNASNYEFLNFENDVICGINYSLKNVTIQNGKLLYPTFTNLNIDGNDFTRIFLYLFNPPKLKCVYSICTVDDANGSNLDVIEKIDSDSFFYERDYPVIINKYYCVKVDVYDSLNASEKVFIEVFKQENALE